METERKEVCIIVEENLTEDGGQEINVYAYDNIENARKTFEHLMDVAKKNASDDYSFEKYYDGDMGWSLWKTGDFNNDHYTLTMFQRYV